MNKYFLWRKMKNPFFLILKYFKKIYLFYKHVLKVAPHCAITLNNIFWVAQNCSSNCPQKDLFLLNAQFPKVYSLATQTFVFFNFFFFLLFSFGVRGVHYGAFGEGGRKEGERGAFN
jgi:hypothetical protein